MNTNFLYFIGFVLLIVLIVKVSYNIGYDSCSEDEELKWMDEAFTKVFESQYDVERNSNGEITMIKPKRNKYKNTKVAVNGEVFDSKAEAKRFHELAAMVETGEIQDLTRQPKFILQEGFDDIDAGEHIRPITYKADFMYRDEDGNWVVEDVKSWITQKDKAYRLKVKLFRKRYPEYRFKEVLM